MSETKEEICGFPCRACGNRLLFSPSRGALVCPYCKREEPIASSEIEAPEYTYDPNDDSAAAPDWEEATERTFFCPACGAGVVHEPLSMTVSCPFCGSQFVAEPKAGYPLIRPETMVPFAVEKEAAAANCRTFAKRRFFAPRAFRHAAEAEGLQGVYVPHFTFDADLETAYRGQGGRHRTVTYTTVSNGKPQTHTRVVTDWYPIAGTAARYLDDEPFCASAHVDRGLLDKIRPFSLKVLKVYDPAYLAGFFAERYAVGLRDGFAAVRPQMERKMERYIEEREGYDEYSGMTYRHDYRKVLFKHILLPVWMASFRYRGKVYPLLVNGETGKVAGKSPLSPLRVLLAVLAGAAFFAMICFFLWLAEEPSLAAALPT